MLDNAMDHLQWAANNFSQSRIIAVKDNLTYSERRALKELRNDHFIIIKEADKRGSVCVRDTTFYKETIAEMLKDSKTKILPVIINNKLSNRKNIFEATTVQSNCVIICVFPSFVRQILFMVNIYIHAM